MDFGQAIHALKNGKKVARDFWSFDQFLYHVPANSYPAQTEIAKAHFGENALVPYNAYIAVKNYENRVMVWSPTQDDILAQDWALVD